MKTILATLLVLVGSSAYGETQQVTSVFAFFNPATESRQCGEAILGSQPDKIIAFESDGRVKLRLDVQSKADGTISGLEVFKNHKAFVPYFDVDKTPKLYENGPQLVKAHDLQLYLPSISSYNKFVLIGYGVPFVRVISEVQKNTNGKGLYVRQTLDSAYKSDPKLDEISPIRTAELSIDSREIEIQVTREYSFNDPSIPKYYKTTAVWTRDFHCKLQRY